MHLNLEKFTTGDRKQDDKEPKKTKVRKRRGPGAHAIEEVFATLSNARSSGLNPPPERIILTPRSAEACLRCGVNPETLKIRDLDSFYDPDVTTAVQRMRYEAYSLRRHEEMQTLRAEKRKLLEAEDRGGVIPSRLVAISGPKRGSHSANGLPSSSSSSSATKNSSSLLNIERQRLEKVRQRQERELEQMLEFEMKMNRLQQEAADKMEREKRQHEAMERSRVRFAQELAVEKRAREIKKKAQLDAEEERRKEMATQLAARDRALAEEKARQDKVRRLEAREREEERKIKAEEHRAQTEALLRAQQTEIQTRLKELDLAEKAREEMVELQRAERATAMDARRREVTQRIRKNLRASKKLEAQRKREIQRKQAASEAVRRAHEEEERRSRELQTQQQLALEKKRQLVLEETRREEARRRQELLERQRETERNVQQVQRSQEQQRALRSEYRKLQAQLKADKVERMKRVQEYQRLEMLRRLQDTEARTQHMLNEKESLVTRRKQLAIQTKIQRDLIMRTMENVKITKKWHQASKTIEKVLNGGNTNRPGGSANVSERPKSSSGIVGRQTSLPTLSQPTTPHDHSQSKVFQPPSPPPTRTAFKFSKETQQTQNSAAGSGTAAQPYFSPYDAAPEAEPPPSYSPVLWEGLQCGVAHFGSEELGECADLCRRSRLGHRILLSRWVALLSRRSRSDTEMVLALGREKEGIPVEVLQLVDVCVEIPQFGLVRSLNVHVSGPLVLWEYTQQQLMSGAFESTL
ncbi:SpoU rRNA Methylase family [Phytophthora infestans]|uniref:SpoU rRNA Methylase family n=1 Tax=Phytophthora infestans TaxID=4787 RepID=A0A833WHR4_PHYIN|nr:SpoU rRNA Methylase family [Phytophthora infestans]